VSDTPTFDVMMKFPLWLSKRLEMALREEQIPLNTFVLNATIESLGELEQKQARRLRTPV
jgi:hypothetical protein